MRPPDTLRLDLKEEADTKRLGMTAMVRAATKDNNGDQFEAEYLIIGIDRARNAYVVELTRPLHMVDDQPAITGECFIGGLPSVDLDP